MHHTCGVVAGVDLNPSPAHLEPIFSQSLLFPKPACPQQTNVNHTRPPPPFRPPTLCPEPASPFAPLATSRPCHQTVPSHNRSCTEILDRPARIKPVSTQALRPRHRPQHRPQPQSRLARGPSQQLPSEGAETSLQACGVDQQHERIAGPRFKNAKAHDRPGVPVEIQGRPG